MEDEKPDVECGPDGDVCVIDTKKLIEERAKKGEKSVQSEKNSIIFLITRGTYGRFDDAYGAILVANAALAKQQAATLLLLGNGIYLGMKDQEPSDIFLPNNLPEISDFIELGGRILVHQDSMDKRGVEQDELLEDVEIIDNNRIITEIENHNNSLTF
jgi:sulfur relay (sulfurtransferase) DsrF/TusC family protein